MAPMKLHKQQELFEEFVIREKRKGRFFGAFKFKKPLFPQHRLNLSVSYEALIICLIGLVLVVSVIFSLGVERGRNLEFAQAPSKNIQVASEAEVKETQVKPEEKPAQIQKQPEVKPEVKPKEGQIEKVVPPPSEEKPFTIQVATYKTRNLAERELSRLKKIGYSSEVFKKGEYFIVCVGAYAQKELAQQALPDLKRIYKDCYVRRR